MIRTSLLSALLWLVVYFIARWLHRRGRPDRQRDVLAAGLLALACLGYFWRILFGDAYMPADGGDLISFLWPTYKFASYSLRSGTLPLWNPHLYGGAPHVADIQAGFLYPPNLLIFLLRPRFGVRGMEKLSILHFWWAGLGMYVFLRSLRWRIKRPAALAAGIAFAFSDPFWVHFGNLNFIAVASWLPWVMACFVRALEGEGEAGRQGDREAGRQVDKETGRQGEGASRSALHTPHVMVRIARGWGLSWAAAGGVLLGIGTLAGHIQATLFIGLAVVIYGLFWLYGELRVDDKWQMANGRSQMADGRWQMAKDGSPLATRHPPLAHNKPNTRYRIPNIPSPLSHLLAATAVFAIVAFLLAAPVLLPALELARYSTRADWTYQQSVSYSLAPAQWIGFLVPGFFGRGPQLHWGPWPRVEVGYLGVLPLALAALALLARRERRTWTLAGLSLVAFLLALGVYSIPHGWLSLLPGFNLLRAPARFALLVDFGLAALAGLGLQVLIEPVSEGENWRALTRLADGLGWAAKVALAVVVPLTLGAVLLAQDKDPSIYIRVAVAAIAILLFVAFLLASWGLVAARKAGWAEPRTLAALAVLLIFLDLASTGAYNDIGGQNPTQGFRHPEIVSFLYQEREPFRIDARTDVDQLWQPDTALLYGLDDVWGVANPSILAHYEHYWEGMGSRSSRLYDFLNAKYVIARKDVTLDWEKFELAFDGDPQLNVYRNRNVLPRAFIVHDVRLVDSAEAAWNAIHRPDFDPGRQVVVQGGEEAVIAPAQPPAGQRERVIWRRRTANELELEVTMTAPGYLVLSEVWYPGWRAEVAGAEGGWQRRPVLRANYAFRAVPLAREGTYRVRLRFAPTSWRLGLVASGVMGMLLAVGVLRTALLSGTRFVGSMRDAVGRDGR